MLYAFMMVVFFLIMLFLLNATNFFFPESNITFSGENHPLMHPGVTEILPQERSKKVVMCIHGFASTPATFQDYVTRFELEGYDTLVPRLPGCGTSPEDFSQTRYIHWYEHVKELYLHYRPHYEHFHIIGFSIGGSLTLHLAEEFNKSDLTPSSIAIAGTPVFLNSFWKNRVIRYPGLYFSGLLRTIIPFRLNSNGKIRNHQLPDNASAWMGYYGIFPAQTHSLKIALKKIRRNLPKIRSPLYAVHAHQDKTVPFQNLFEILSQVQSPIIKSRCFDLGEFSHTRHLLFLYDSTRDILFTEILDFFQSVENHSSSKPLTS